MPSLSAAMPWLQAIAIAATAAVPLAAACPLRRGPFDEEHVGVATRTTQLAVLLSATLYLLLGYGLQTGETTLGLAALPGPLGPSVVLGGVETLLHAVAAVSLAVGVSALLVCGLPHSRRRVALGAAAVCSLLIVPVVMHWVQTSGWLSRLGGPVQSPVLLLLVAAGAGALGLRKLLPRDHERPAPERLIVSALLVVGFAGWVCDAARTGPSTLAAISATALVGLSAAGVTSLLAANLSTAGQRVLLGLPIGLLAAIGTAGDPPLFAALVAVIAVLVVCGWSRFDAPTRAEQFGAAAIVILLTAPLFESPTPQSVGLQAFAIFIVGLWSLALCGGLAILVDDETESPATITASDREMLPTHVTNASSQHVAVTGFAEEPSPSTESSAATIASVTVASEGNETAKADSSSQDEQPIAALVEQYEATVGRLNDALREANGAEQAAIAARAEADTQNQTLRGEVDQLRSQLAEASAAVDDLNRRESERAIDPEMQSELERQLAEQTEAAAEERASFDRRLSEATDAFEAEHRALTASLDAANDECTARTSERDAARIEAGELKQQCESLATQVEAAEGRVRTLETTAVEQSQALAERDEQLATAHSDLQAAQLALAEQQEPDAEAVATETLCREQKKQIQRLMTDLAEARGRLHQLDGRETVDPNELNRLREANTTLQRQLEAAEAREAADVAQRTPDDTPSAAPTNLGAEPVPQPSDRESLDPAALLELCMNDRDLACDLLRQVQQELPNGLSRFRDALDGDDLGQAGAAIEGVRAFTDQLPLGPLGQVVATTAAAVERSDTEGARQSLGQLEKRLDETIARTEQLIAELQSGV